MCVRFFPKKTILALSVTTAIALSLPFLQAGADADTAAQEQITFNNQLVDAAESNDVALISALLNFDSNPNERGDFGTTALIRSAYHGSKEITEMLLKKGANPNLADIGGATPLHVASRQGNTEIAELLIKYGAKIDQADKEGNTPLMAASANNSTEIVKLLASAGSDVNKTNQQGESAIVFAADIKNAEAAKTLVESGADTNVVDQEGSNLTNITARKASEQLIAAIGKMNLPEAIPALLEEKPFDIAENQPTKIDWFKDLKKVFSEEKGALQKASVTNYEQGKKYFIVDLGSFKGKEFADKKVTEVKAKYAELLGESGVSVSEKNGTFSVTVGVFDNNADAEKICKKLVADGSSCRMVETTMLSKDDFSRIAKPVVPENTPAVAEVKDAITPAPVEKVEAKIVEKIEVAKNELAQTAPQKAQPATENIGGALKPMSEQAAKEEKKSVSDLLEMAAKPAAPTPPATPVKTAGKVAEKTSEKTPAQVAAVTEQDKNDMTALIEKINSQPPAPAPTSAAKAEVKKAEPVKIELAKQEIKKVAEPTKAEAPAPKQEIAKAADTINIEATKISAPAPKQEAVKLAAAPAKVTKPEPSSFERLKALITGDDAAEEKPAAAAPAPEPIKLASAEPVKTEQQKIKPAKILDNKEKVETKISKPSEVEMPVPALEKKPHENKHQEKITATEKVEVAPAPVPVKAAEAKVEEETTEEAQETKPAPAKEPAPEPKIVKVPQEEKQLAKAIAEPAKKEVALSPKAPTKTQAELEKPPITNEHAIQPKAIEVKTSQEIIPPILPKPQFVAQPVKPTEEPKPAEQAKLIEPPKTLEPPKSEPIKIVVPTTKEETKITTLPPLPASKPDMAKPIIVIAEQTKAELPPAQEKLKVSTPIKVEQPTTITAAPAPILQPATQQVLPRTTLSAKQYWVKVDSFEAEDDVFSFWKQVSSFSNSPSAGAIAVQSAATGKYIAQVGPFSSAFDTSKFCEAIYNFSEENDMKLRCMTNKLLPNSRSGRNNIGSNLQSGSERHSTLKSGGELGNYVYNPNDFGNYYVQIGSYSSSADAMARWEALKSQIERLNKLEPSIVSSSGTYSSGKVYLRTGNFEFRDSANDLCSDLREKMISCIIIKA